ncbi:MAG: EAL domain-containing protein [Lachnospiraceae bacterium]|nr:EAL domain-containing protein [Lachnospiraceae bacterium]
MTLFEMIDKSAFHIGAILVVISCIAYIKLKWHINEERNNYFVWGLVALLIQAVSSIVLIYGLEHTELENSRIIYLTANYVYFVFHAIMAPFLLEYTLLTTQIYTILSRKTQILISLPFWSVELLMITNPLTEWSYYHDMDGTFHRSFGEYYMYFVSIIYIAVAVRILLGWWTAISSIKKKILAVSFSISLMGLAIQFFVPFIEIELFAESLTMLGVTLAIEYDDERLDSISRVYNRAAFIADINSFLKLKKSFYVLTVKIMDMKYLNATLGISSEDLQAQVAERLAKVHERFRIYHVTPSVFALFVPGDDEKRASLLAGDIKNELSFDMEISGIVLPIRFCLTYAKMPEEIRDMDSLILLCESDVPGAKNGMIISGEELNYIYYRGSMNRAIREGIKNHSFEMYYQLIYSGEDMSIHAAESLLRLHDKELGLLYPDDFIYAAERIGLIDQISRYVLREVCAFVKSNIPQKAGINYISVNLSISQCMDVDFADRAYDLVKSFEVDPGMINFEISENMAFTDYRYVSRVIRGLRKKGFLVSLQGYGTGYADNYSIFSIDFDAIKLDKSLLWHATKSDQGRIIFENSVRMLKELGKRIIAIGVETKLQSDLVRSSGIDGIQGMFFSGPMSATDLSKIV